jgi:hypothetical protein
MMLARAAAVLLLVAAAACARGGALKLPTGAGVPFPGFDSAWEQATAECRTVTSITAVLGLSGKAGRTKLRGRIEAGLAERSRIRLDGFPPVMFGGKPFFTLVGEGNEATLVLPRDERVLRGATPVDIVEALAGVPLAPDDLRRVLAGCGVHRGEPSNARSFENGWAAADAGEGIVYLRQTEGRWRIVAGTRGELTLEYSEFAEGRPGRVRIRTAADGGEPSDLNLRLSQVEVNVPIDAAAFEVEVPPAYAPLTLDELRRAGPLGDRGGSR